MMRPWMPLYIAEYLRDTRRLTAAEHGAYLLLIMEYWTVGGLPTDDASLARIACMLPAEWKRAKPAIVPYFTTDWKHKRIENELAKCAEISSKRRASALQRHYKSDANAELKDTHAGVNCSSVSLSSATSSESLESQTEQASGKFALFWREYPHKVGKKAAEKAFKAALKSVEFSRLIEALADYKNKADDRPWCNPATWLNEGRWDDEPAIQAHGGAVGTDRDIGKADFKQALRELREFGERGADGDLRSSAVRVLPAPGRGE